MDDRSQYVLQVTDNMLDVHAAWCDSDDQIVTEALYDAIEEVIQVCSEGTIPGALRSLFERAGELAGVWRKWVSAVEATRDGVVPLPGQGVWAAIDGVAEARKQATHREPPPLESIEDLMKLNPPVSDTRIAIMFGWFTERVDGRPTPGPEDIQRVKEEKREPGKHTDPKKGFVHPQLKERLAAEKVAAENIERVKRNRERKIELMVKPPPESIEELAKQGVSATQIASSYGWKSGCDENGRAIPNDEDKQRVLAACDEAGVERPVLGYSLDQPTPEIVEDHSEQPGKRVEVDGALTIEQEIIVYHKEGMGHKQISDAMSRPDEKVSWQKVKAIVDRYAKEPEAFNMPVGV